MSRSIPLSQPFLSELESNYVSNAVQSGWLTQAGKYVELMENYIGDRINGSSKSHAVTTTSNGTTALHLVLLSLGVVPGDEIIVPDFGYIAPVNAVLMCGAVPVVVDVDINTWCLDPILVKKAITKNSKAVIAIDNYGALANIEEIKKLIPQNIPIIEDAAESFPLMNAAREVSFLGDFITTSFYANKIVTSAEGGAVAGSSEFIEKIKSLKNQSVKGRGTFEHIDIGYNYRISNLHAAVFVAQWERIEEILDHRIRVFNYYHECLNDLEINFASNQFPKIVNPWLMTIRLIDVGVSIEELRSKLLEKGIETRPGFKPASEHEYLLGKIKIDGETKNSKILHSEIMSLPTFPELENHDIEYICNSLRQALEN